MKTIELLAPAGSYESLNAGIQAGADAVYLSGSQFGARQFANNFDEVEILKAISHAHIRNVKVYVTVNTLIKDDEWSEVTKYIDFLYINDVDAIIVQDLGVADYIRTNYPDLDLHGSTQMSCHHLNDFIFLKEFGFKRVVAGREMTVEEIKVVKDSLDIEVEVFVHGALCVCYSGQCLMSSVIGGRSGNRGRCAQPCRQVYDFNGDKSYALSPKDLNAIDHLEDLREIGVDSLKIEGRMKGPEYAWTVVKAYKNKLMNISEEDHLNQIFHRPYTAGLLMKDTDWVSDEASGNRGEFIGTVKSYDADRERLTILMHKILSKGDEIQIRQKNSSVGARTDIFYLKNAKVTNYKLSDEIEVPFKYQAFKGEEIYRTYDATWMKAAQQSYHKNVPSMPVSMSIEIKIDQPIKFTLTDKMGHKISVESEVCGEVAKNKALDEERVLQQLKKLGQTAYILEDYKIDLDENVSIPVKAINELRRMCVESLDQKRALSYDRKKKVITSHSKGFPELVMPKLAVAVSNAAQREALEGLDIDYIYYNEDIPVLPKISTQEIDERYKSNDGIKVLSNYGQIALYGDQPWIGNYSLNVFNSKTLETYSKLNCQRMTLSYECSKKEIANIKTDLPLELIVYGRVPVMVTKYCPVIKKTMACEKCPDLCKNHPGLVDKYEATFPLMKSETAMTVLSHKPLHLMPHLKSLFPGSIEVFRLSFTIETPEEVIRITKGYIEYLISLTDTLNLTDVTDYHFLKGVE